MPPFSKTAEPWEAWGRDGGAERPRKSRQLVRKQKEKVGSLGSQKSPGFIFLDRVDKKVTSEPGAAILEVPASPRVWNYPQEY